MGATTRARSRRRHATPSADILPADVLQFLFNRFVVSPDLVCRLAACCQTWRRVIHDCTTALHIDCETVLDSRAAAIASRRPWLALVALRLDNLSNFRAGLLCGVNCTGFTHVTTLRLTFTDFNCDEGLRHLLGQMPNVVHLSLDTGPDCLQVEPLLMFPLDSAMSSRLQTLELNVCAEEDDELSSRAELTCSPASLKGLARTCSQLTTLSVRAMASVDNDVLREFSQLTHLRVRACSRCSWSGLIPLSKLQTLHIGLASHGFDISESFMTVVLEACLELTELVMYGIDAITGRGFDLPDGVGCRLHSLALNNCIGLTNAGIQAIACHPLEKFAIEETDIQCHGDEPPSDLITTAGIVELVVRCRSLRHLNIENDYLDEPTAEQLHSIVEGCPLLESLDCYTSLDEDSLPLLHQGGINQPCAAGPLGRQVRLWFADRLDVWDPIERNDRGVGWG